MGQALSANFTSSAFPAHPELATSHHLCRSHLGLSRWFSYLEYCLLIGFPVCPSPPTVCSRCTVGMKLFPGSVFRLTRGKSPPLARAARPVQSGTPVPHALSCFHPLPSTRSPLPPSLHAPPSPQARFHLASVPLSPQPGPSSGDVAMPHSHLLPTLAQTSHAV